jgi:hypothetical protein
MNGDGADGPFPAIRAEAVAECTCQIAAYCAKTLRLTGNDEAPAEQAAPRCGEP